MFRLPAGQENNILERNWYELGNPDTRLFDRLDQLPADLQLVIVEHLLKFDTKIHITKKSRSSTLARPTYGFVIAQPVHLIKPNSMGMDDEHGPHEDKVWSMGANVLALASTNRKWCGLARQGFNKKNSFEMGPFGSQTSASDSQQHHFDLWRQRIGEQACYFFDERSQ